LNHTTIYPNFLINQSKFWEIVREIFFTIKWRNECFWFDNFNSITIFHNNDRLRTIQWNSIQMNNIWMWR
jgi:hypothetical protein